VQRLPWDRAGEEPSIADLLSDPTGQALLRADGLTAMEVILIVAQVRVRREARAKTSTDYFNSVATYRGLVPDPSRVALHRLRGVPGAIGFEPSISHHPSREVMPNVAKNR
jgi:hypothetical protein